MRKILSKLTYANVMATLAVFFVLGGGAAFAAGKLAKNSVGPRQLRKNSVNSAKVKNHSLKAVDFKAGQLPAGKRGPKGEAGTSALDVVPSGATIHGAWSLSGNSSRDYTSPTFPIPAPQPVDSEHVVVAGNDIITGDGCTGSAADPVAAPGFVCIYFGHVSGPTNSAHGFGANADPVTPVATDGSRFGFMIEVDGGPFWLANGTWAYTAP
jgi:hypothetical protein